MQGEVKTLREASAVKEEAHDVLEVSRSQWLTSAAVNGIKVDLHEIWS